MPINAPQKSHLERSEQKVKKKQTTPKSGHSEAVYIHFWPFFGPFFPSNPIRIFQNRTFWNALTIRAPKSSVFGADNFVKPMPQTDVHYNGDEVR